MKISSRFKNKSAIITGGASGIGKSIAERIANEEGLVIIWDKNIDDFKIDSSKDIWDLK